MSEDDNFEIVKKDDIKNSITSLDENLGGFLKQLNLPTESVIVEIENRIPIFQNAPAILVNLPENIKEEAYYLSKFFVSSAVGLFDAALNYLWDELINNLRKKIEN